MENRLAFIRQLAKNLENNTLPSFVSYECAQEILKDQEFIVRKRLGCLDLIHDSLPTTELYQYFFDLGMEINYLDDED